MDARQIIKRGAVLALLCAVAAGCSRLESAGKSAATPFDMPAWAGDGAVAKAVKFKLDT